MGGMERMKGERSERQSDRAETHDQNGLYLGRFDVGKVRCFIKNALCLYLELCFLRRRGSHFHKNREKSGRMVKNGAKIMSDTSLLHQAGVGYIKMS